MFDHFLCFWKSILNGSLDSTWLHHLLERRGLQRHFPQDETKTCRSICFMSSLNPIKAAKKRAGQNRSGEKKMSFFWSPPHATSRRHEPIKWGVFNIPRFVLIESLIFFLCRKPKNSLTSHIQQKASCTKPYQQVILKNPYLWNLCRSPFCLPQFCGGSGRPRTLVTPLTVCKHLLI